MTAEQVIALVTAMPDVDYAAFDRVLPHPIYAGQSWVCVVNPGPDSDAALRDLLAHARWRAAEKRRA